MIELELAEPWQPPERAVLRPVTVRIVAAAVSVVLLGLLGGGQRLDAHEPVFRLVGQVHQAVMVRDTLVVQTSRPERLQAFRMPGGQRRWSRDLTSSLVFITGQQDVIFLAEFDPRGGAIAATRALDAGSGRELWQRADTRIVARAGDRLVGVRSSKPDGPVEPTAVLAVPRGPTELSVLDARSGVAFWSRTLPAGAVFSYTDGWCAAGRPAGDGIEAFTTIGPLPGTLADIGGDCGRLYDLGPDGMLHTREVATGEVVASTPTALPTGVGLSVVGRVALIQQRDGTISASDLPDGRPLWRSVEDPIAGSLGACGDSVCLFGTDGTVMLDPVTGSGRRGFGPAIDAYRTNGRIVTIEQQRLRIGLVDAASGRRMNELRGWAAAGMYDGTRVVATQGGLDGPARVAIVDLLTGRQRTIARADSGLYAPACTGSDHRLVCWNGIGLAVWSVATWA